MSASCVFILPTGSIDMSNKTLNLDADLYRYLQLASLREPEVLQALREKTAELPLAVMQVSPEQGQFMALLVRLLGARRCLEVGVFTGYSALAVALALPKDGRLVGCDIEVGYTDVAQRYWRKAGVEDKITLHLAPAVDTLQALIDAGESDSYDFAFIDADKTSYRRYYEQCLTLLRPGGLVAIDNVLWGGAVADASNNEADTVAIRELNDFIATDERVDISMVPIGDGLTLARKR